jgi:hypothetical protein
MGEGGVTCNKFDVFGSPTAHYNIVRHSHPKQKDVDRAQF